MNSVEYFPSFAQTYICQGVLARLVKLQDYQRNRLSYAAGKPALGLGTQPPFSGGGQAYDAAVLNHQPSKSIHINTRK
jgi:hypothetical protein